MLHKIEGSHRGCLVQVWNGYVECLEQKVQRKEMARNDTVGVG